MNPTDSDYAAFLDRLPELRRLYDPRLHQFEVTKGLGTGDSLGRVERYFARVGSVRGPNRQTLRRLVAFVDHVRAGMSREDAVKQAWRDFPILVMGFLVPSALRPPCGSKRQDRRVIERTTTRSPSRRRGALTVARRLCRAYRTGPHGPAALVPSGKIPMGPQRWSLHASRQRRDLRRVPGDPGRRHRPACRSPGRQTINWGPRCRCAA